MTKLFKLKSVPFNGHLPARWIFVYHKAVLVENFTNQYALWENFRIFGHINSNSGFYSKIVEIHIVNNGIKSINICWDKNIFRIKATY